MRRRGMKGRYLMTALGPGFTAGSSIAVGIDEQARVAGAIAAVNGINVIFAPAFVFLYQHYGPLPFLLNTALMAWLLVYAFRNAALKNADPQPATREAATLATREKRDEGGGGV